MNQTLLRIALFSIFIFVVLALRPIMNPSIEQCSKVMGTLEKLVPNQNSKDIGIRLNGDSRHYYINRGLETSGLIAALENLPGEEIEIYPVNHWTPLDPTNSVRHVAQVVHNGKVLYSEFD